MQTTEPETPLGSQLEQEPAEPEDASQDQEQEENVEMGEGGEGGQGTGEETEEETEEVVKQPETPAEEEEEEGVPAEKEEAPAAEEERTTEQVEPGKGVLETGHIYFLYRPNVRTEEVESLDDVQRMFMILKPTEGGGKNRLIVVGKKKLPAVHERNRFWSFVEATADSIGELTERFEEGEAGAVSNAKSNKTVRPAGGLSRTAIDSFQSR